MIRRNEKGRLALKSSRLRLLFLELFEECDNEREVEWLRGRIDNVLNMAQHEILEWLELEEEDEE